MSNFLHNDYITINDYKTHSHTFQFPMNYGHRGFPKKQLPNRYPINCHHGLSEGNKQAPSRNVS